METLCNFQCVSGMAVGRFVMKQPYGSSPAATFQLFTSATGPLLKVQQKSRYSNPVHAKTSRQVSAHSFGVHCAPHLGDDDEPKTGSPRLFVTAVYAMLSFVRLV